MKLSFTLLTFVLLCGHLWAQVPDLKKYYKPLPHFTGEWVINMSQSNSRTNGGIFLTKLLFQPNEKSLSKIDSKLRTYNNSKLFQLNIDTLSNFSITGCGTVSFSLLSRKLNTTTTESGLYVFARAGSMLKLILFFDGGKLSEFGEFIPLEVLNDVSRDKEELNVCWAEVRSEYFFERVAQPTKSFSPIVRNKKPLLNNASLSGSVKKVYTKSFKAEKMPSGEVVPKEFRGSELRRYDKVGNLLEYGHPGNPYSPGPIISYQSSGSYESQVLTPVGRAEDSIVVKRTEDREITKYHKYGKVNTEIRSNLLNGQVINEESQTDGYIAYITNEYDKKGDVVARLMRDSANKLVRETYYQYLDYDSLGNWTRRVTFFKSGDLERPDLIEIREVTYFEQ
jgi:hypothetical protein